MATREVKYTTSGPTLPCERCLPAEVILATYPPLVLHAYDDLKGFIQAQLIEVAIAPNLQRIFTFNYDDALLFNPSIPLLSTDLFGFFCITLKEEWMRDIARRSQPIVIGSNT